MLPTQEFQLIIYLFIATHTTIIIFFSHMTFITLERDQLILLLQFF